MAIFTWIFDDVRPELSRYFWGRSIELCQPESWESSVGATLCLAPGPVRPRIGSLKSSIKNRNLKIAPFGYFYDILDHGTLLIMSFERSNLIELLVRIPFPCLLSRTRRCYCSSSYGA